MFDIGKITWFALHARVVEYERSNIRIKIFKLNYFSLLAVFTQILLLNILVPTIGLVAIFAKTLQPTEVFEANLMLFAIVVKEIRWIVIILTS